MKRKIRMRFNPKGAELELVRGAVLGGCNLTPAQCNELLEKLTVLRVQLKLEREKRKAKR